MFPDNNWYGHRYVLSNFCEVEDYQVTQVFTWMV